MKNLNNLKNTAAAITLMATLAFGSVSASAGILVSDKNGAAPCSSVKGDMLTQLSGILAVGLPMLNGILISDRSGFLLSDRSGLMVSDKASGCTSKDGILISDRSGILVSDRSGVIMSD